MSRAVLNSKSRSKSQKQKTYDAGVAAESAAEEYLSAKGYAVLARRYKTKYGEIDLIIRRDDLIAFVEVKARSSIDEALSSITPKMRERIQNSALMYLSENPEAGLCDLRFDVVAVSTSGGGDKTITHLDNAWMIDS